MAFSRRLESKTINQMINMYCRKVHGQGAKGLCLECQQLYEYAAKRIDKCFYGDQKPVCSKCPVHCYKPEMLEAVKTVMQYSGPRIWIKRPLLSIRYLYRKRFKSRVPAPTNKKS